jgi:hypothetical protein
MNTNEIKVECDVNIDDITAWNYYYLQNNAQSKRNLKLIRFVFMPIMAVLFILGVVLLLMDILMPHGEMSATNVVLILIGGGGFLVYLFYLNNIRDNLRKTINKMYSQGKNDVVGPQKYSISSEGVRDTNELSEGIVKWEAVENVVQTGNHLFITIRPNKSFIIPKRAFSDDASFNQFVQDVRTIFEASHKSS